MEKALKVGKARSIGVSNWNVSHLEEMLQYAETPPAINQIEAHPFFPNTELINYCFSRQILPVAYSPLGKTRELVSSNKKLTVITERKKVTLAQILLAWGLRRGYAVVPKSFNINRLKSNLEMIELSDAEFETVSGVAEGKQKRFVNSVDLFGYQVWPEHEEAN